MAAARALAVDVGGTKMEVGVVDDAGVVVRSARAATAGAGDDGEALFGALARLIESVSGGDEVVCGVGCGGPMVAGGEAVSPLNIPAWREFPLRPRLAALTGLAVFVDNDAKALALGGAA